MIKGIDHLVIVVNNLEQAAKDYETLGFTVVHGGKHPVGTHNVLISFADGSYLEMIAFYREAPDHRWWSALQSGERLVDVCMQTDDLTGDTAKFREAGVNINDPVPWSRTRPDGFELKWLLSLATGDDRGVAPFLIQDITPREERVPANTGHKNGAVGIESVTIAIAGNTSAERWQKIFAGAPATNFADDMLSAEGIRFRFGPHVLEYATATGPESPLADCLRNFGPSPYAATLFTEQTNPALMDVSLTHGANLSFVTKY
jgi:catechol 2,3-dioxygenase-like lactoylglutathione lyase family enzyme